MPAWLRDAVFYEVYPQSFCDTNGDGIGMRYVEGLVSKEGGYDRTGSRTPMQWSDAANYGFTDASPDKLHIPVDPRPDAPTVEAQARDPLSLLNTVAGLIHLRHANPDLQADGLFSVLYAEKRLYPFVYRRGALVIGVNPSTRPAVAPVNTMGEALFSLGELPVRSERETAMAPQSFFVVQV